MLNKNIAQTQINPGPVDTIKDPGTYVNNATPLRIYRYRFLEDHGLKNSILWV